MFEDRHLSRCGVQMMEAGGSMLKQRRPNQKKMEAFIQHKSYDEVTALVSVLVSAPAFIYLFTF